MYLEVEPIELSVTLMVFNARAELKELEEILKKVESCRSIKAILGDR